MAFAFALVVEGGAHVGALDADLLWNAPTAASDYVGSHPELRILVNTPRFNWLGEQTSPAIVDGWRSKAAGETLPIVLYGIPQRDAGGFSAGGFANAQRYLGWVAGVARSLGGAHGLVVVEPDALAQSLGFTTADREQRLRVIGSAVHLLKSRCPHVAVYVDASTWVPPVAMAGLLKQANIAEADGYSLNVSNYLDDDSVFRYGNELSPLVGGKHYIVDTSRNGRGAYDGPDAWCNPPGRGLGRLPTTSVPAQPLVEGLFWIKTPGNSDGICRGGPSAGTFWLESALELVRNATAGSWGQ